MPGGGLVVTSAATTIAAAATTTTTTTSLRMFCSPSEDSSGETPRELEAGGDNSPVATDEEEEEEEEEHRGEHNASAASLPNPSQELCDPEKDNDKSRSTESIENPSPKSQPESHRVTPTPASTHTPTHTPSPPAPNPLASLCSMTVPAQVEEAGPDVSKEEDNKSTPGTSTRKSSTPKNHSSSPTAMASVMIPMPSVTKPVLPSPEKDTPRLTSSAQKSMSRHRGHSSFYEKMAAQALAAASATSAAAAAAAAAMEVADDQPLDLSRKSSRPRSVSEPDPPPTTRWEGKRGSMGKEGKKADESANNGISSLQSLQKRFGGDFLLETPRRPSSIIPLQSTILPSKSILRPPPIPGNGLSHLSISAAAAAAAASTSTNHQHQQPHHHHHHHHHHHSSSSLTTKSKSTGSLKADRIDKMMSIATSTNSTATVRKTEKPPETSDGPRKTESSKMGKNGSGPTGAGNGSKEIDGDNKYTIHRCSCQKSFGTLYALSAHLQETGHVPSSSKQQSLMDYPKLVRGQDMWLNQESEQTRRILRCMQCGESFKSLPMLTVHMMQTQHYSKIVSAEHGRRSHKCSAYCDRELDRECIFKCKVCQETFTDMEGLANHMIVSGHHKKQVLRSHNCTDLALRHKHRKRYLSDEASGSTVASLLEYKRKYQGGSGGSNGYLPQIGGSSGTATPSSSDGLVMCESCGKKIEMPWFVEHVRLCLRQKAEVIDALKVKLFGEECSGGGSGKPAKTCTSLESQSKSPDSLEQPLPSTRDTALFKRLNSISSSSPDKESGADSVHKDTTKDEESKDDAESQEMDANENEHDGPVFPSREKSNSGVRSEDQPRHTPSPKSSQKDDEESCTTSKQNASSPKDEPVEETPTEENELGKETKGEPETETGTKKMEEMPAIEGRCLSPRIPSPMTDEENTSERSPSPPSDPSQSDDSKPPSPAPSSPPSKPDPTPPPQDMSQSMKRERDPDTEEVAENPKKIKLEDTDDRPKEEAKEAKTTQNSIRGKVDECELVQKIKLEIPDDASTKGTPSPVDKSPSPLPLERRADLNGKSMCNLQDLDIIDPNCGEEPAKESGSSALKAMESFIQRSFSSKFDSRRNAMSAAFGSISGGPHIPPLLNMSRVVPRSSASPSAASMTYLSQFSRFLSPVQPSSSKYLDLGMDSPVPSFEKNVLSSLSAKSAELLEKTRSPIRDITGMKSVTANGLPVKPSKTPNKTKPAATTTRNMDDDDKERESEDEREEKKKEAEKLCKEEDLATKYLNLDEEEQQDEKGEKEEGEGGSSPKAGSSKVTSKKSALDSLSSFVYGQPMTSEHPLDSLQKLLTKTSIPKVMATAAGHFPHFSPHHYPYMTEQMMERMCFTPPDLPSSSSAMPLNLSLKPGAGGSSSDEEDHASCHQDCDSPSALRDVEDGNHSSPGAMGPDGELTEFKCAACSRRFASKGSYRYHLSRCHLSSVKKYGIKEAFNMSPYVYLPLDHTAKFTKYYQMAQELASKGK